MSQYFIYYTESSIICLILFGIMLGHNLSMVDRSERVVKYDGALVAFMLYFISDAIWAAIIAGVIPKTTFLVYLINFTNFTLMAFITYMWFRYVAAVEQVPGRNSRKFTRVYSLPLNVSVVTMLLLLIFSPQIVINSDFTVTRFYSLYQVAVPIIYIFGVLFFVLGRASKEESPAEKRRHLYIGMFPLMVVGGGLVQVLLLPETPIFCYCCAILMIVFYIQMLESRISLDPLTGLNNRGQLQRYVAQSNSLFREGKRTYVMMIDVNDFKKINDTYGHAEGDRALTVIASSLKHAASSVNANVFVARYGGDEFVFIIHSDDTDIPDTLSRNIRSYVLEECRRAELPYTITVSIGYEELRYTNDSFRNCLARADQNCYIDKKNK